MGLDDIFENKHGHYRNYDDNKYESASYSKYTGYRDHTKWLGIIKKILSNRKLKVLVILAGTVFLVITIMLIVFLVPVIIKLYNYILQNGLQGLFNGVSDFLDKIWKGSPK